MCATEDSLLLKGLQRSMISRAASGPGAAVYSEGLSHFMAEHMSLASVDQVALASEGRHLQAWPNDGPTAVSCLFYHLTCDALNTGCSDTT